MSVQTVRGQTNIDLIRSLGRVTGRPAAPVDPAALTEVCVRALDLCTRIDRLRNATPKVASATPFVAPPDRPLAASRELRGPCASHKDCALSCASEKKVGGFACPDVAFVSRSRPPRKSFEPDAIEALTAFVPLFFSARSHCAPVVCARPFCPITRCARTPNFFS